MLANNNSKIPKQDLNDIMKSLTSNYFYIVSRWKDNFKTDEVKFYC